MEVVTEGATVCAENIGRATGGGWEQSQMKLVAVAYAGIKPGQRDNHHSATHMLRPHWHMT
jgi:hypothetical protein